MEKQINKKITLLQALLLYIVAVYAPFIRYYTKMSVYHAHQAGWLSFIFNLVLFIPLLYMLYKVTKKFEGQSLHDIFNQVFGKFISKTLSIIYIIWLFILLCLYIKYSGETLVLTTYVYTDIKLMLFLVVVIVGIMLRWGLTVLERMNKLIFALIVLQLIILLVFLFSGFSIKNVTPISTLDIIPLFKTSFYILAISSYISFVFIFNDQIKYGTKNFGKFAFTTGFLTIVSTLIILATLGNLSYELINKLLFPFMSAVKSVYIFKESAGLDALFISMWMLADFITVSFFTYCIVRLIKNVFNLKSQTPALTAVLGFAFFFAVFLNNNVFELVIFSETIVVVCNLALGFVVPLALFITAKARKMI